MILIPIIFTVIVGIATFKDSAPASKTTQEVYREGHGIKK